MVDNDEVVNSSSSKIEETSESAKEKIGTKQTSVLISHLSMRVMLSHHMEYSVDTVSL